MSTKLHLRRKYQIQVSINIVGIGYRTSTRGRVRGLREGVMSLGSAALGFQMSGVA